MKKLNKTVQISILLAVAIVLSIFESVVLIVLPLPGIKIGLANIIALLVLYLGNKKDFVLFHVLKILILALIRTGFGTTFLISIYGTLFSAVFTLLFYEFTKASIFGLSVIGSIFHLFGQVLMLIIIYENFYLLNYMLWLLLVGVFSGFITAYITVLIISKIPKSTLKLGD